MSYRLRSVTIDLFQQVLIAKSAEKKSEGFILDFHKPDGELSIGDTLSLTFDVYASHLGILLIPFLIASTIIGSFGLIVNRYGSNIPSPDPTQPADVYLAEFGPFLANLVILLFVFLLVAWVCTTIATGISTKCTSDILQNGKTKLEEAFRFTSGKLVSLLAATLIVAIIVFLGTGCTGHPWVNIRCNVRSSTSRHNKRKIWSNQQLVEEQKARKRQVAQNFHAASGCRLDFGDNILHSILDSSTIRAILRTCQQHTRLRSSSNTIDSHNHSLLLHARQERTKSSAAPSTAILEKWKEPEA